MSARAPRRMVPVRRRGGRLPTRCHPEVVLTYSSVLAAGVRMGNGQRLGQPARQPQSAVEGSLLSGGRGERKWVSTAATVVWMRCKYRSCATSGGVGIVWQRRGTAVGALQRGATKACPKAVEE